MPSPNQVARQETVKDLNATLSKIPYAVLTHYSGITVENIKKLRTQLRENEVEFKVIKNTLARRAVEGTPLEALKDHFTGPTALAYSDKDPVTLAKTLADFAKKEKNLLIQVGILDQKLLSQEEVKALARVPSREVLLSRLVGSLQSPYAGLVYTLSGVLRKLVYALDAVRRQKEEKGNS